MYNYMNFNYPVIQPVAYRVLQSPSAFSRDQTIMKKSSKEMTDKVGPAPQKFLKQWRVHNLSHLGLMFSYANMLLSTVGLYQ